MFCYNCGSEGHRSDRCNRQQRYTRCPSCYVVAFAPESHKDFCTHRNFLSTQTATTQTVFEIKDIFSVNFASVEPTFLVGDGNRNVEIGYTPLWLSAIESFVTKTGTKSLTFTAARPTNKNITIVDKEEKPVVCLTFNGSTLVVNTRYELPRDGHIAFHYDKPNAIATPENCKIKVNNVGATFKMRINVWNTRFVFDVYPIGPILVDSQQNFAMQSLEQHVPEPDANVLRDEEAREDGNDVMPSQEIASNDTGAQQSLAELNDENVSIVEAAENDGNDVMPSRP